MNIPVLIDGFDMLVDGDLRAAERAADAGPSLTILIRGPAGVGKTILAAQLAQSAALAIEPGRGADIAYGCIELLPAELKAQLEGINLDTKLPHFVTAPFSVGSLPRTFAAVLDLDEPARADALPAAIDALLGAARSAGGTPRVVVVDSLSAGYGLGGDAPRVLADAVAKLAIAKGLVVILVEEAYPEDRSVWPFAVDVVIELRPGERDREMRVAKNRLGFAMPGWHAYSLTRQAGLRVFPHVATYLFDQAAQHRFARFEDWKDRPTQEWGPAVAGAALSAFRGSVTAVLGLDDADLRAVVRPLGQSDHGVEVIVAFDAKTAESASARTSIFVDTPYLTGPKLLATVRRMLPTSAISRVIIGDLGALSNHIEEADLRRAVEVLTALFAANDVPVVLFESGASGWRPTAGFAGALEWHLSQPSGTPRPAIARMADVVVDVVRFSPVDQSSRGIVTVPLKGVRRQF